jgi:hypothetical protein
VLYRPSNSPTTPTTPAITGSALAYGCRSASATERAFIGGALMALTNPTIKQRAVLVGVCVPYIAAAVVIGGDPERRAAVLTGKCSLLDAARKVNSETLAEHFARTTPPEWTEAARTIGTANVWDFMIAPLI